ncbi:MAG: amidohydrolase family protein [Anaerolineae bacterium]
MQHESADMLILGGTILTMDDQGTIIHDGGIAIRHGMLVYVGTEEEARRRYHAPETLRADSCLLIPGLINAHTHAPMTVYRGLADDLPLDTWLKEYIWPAEGRTVNPHMVYWGTLLAADEMIRAGITMFVDMYFFEDDIGRAASDAGMRALLGEALVEFPSPNAKTPAEGLAYVRASLEHWAGHPLVRPILQPHSTYACSPDLLVKSKALADEFGVPWLIHCCETRQEVEDVRRQTGKPPVALLESLGILDPHVVFAHGVHLAEEEIALLAERGVSIVHCPQSNMKLSSGVAPLPALLRAGVNVAFGTDGAASNNDLSLWGDMQAAAMLHKVVSGDPTVLPARQVFWMATRGAAQAFGLDDKLGSLEAGKRADVVMIDLCRPHLIPMYEPYSHLIYALHSSDVRTVIIEGRLVLRDWETLTIDEDEVFCKIGEMAEELGRQWGRDTDWRRAMGQ